MRTIGQTSFNKITHHVVKELEPTALQVVSLAHNTHLVTPAWLKRLIELSKLPHVPSADRSSTPVDQLNLTDSFTLPPESSYYPPASDSTSNTPLPYPWPRLNRVDLFKGLSFILVTASKSQSSLTTKAIYAAVEMVSGRPTTFDVSREVDLEGGKAGKSKGGWAGFLGAAVRKAKERLAEVGVSGPGVGGGLLLVADEKDLKRICGKDVWNGLFLKTAKRCVDVYYLHCFLIRAALSIASRWASSIRRR